MRTSTLGLAWRNLWRSRTRTAITGSAIAFSLALQLMSYGIAGSSYEKMITGAVRAAGGSVLVHARGYWSLRSADQVIPEASGLRAAVEGVDGVDVVSPRLLLNGLVSSARDSAGALLVGIEPAAEARLDDRSRFLLRGTFLTGDSATPLVLDKRVVEDLKLDLGDRVVITTTDAEGELIRLPFRLTGVLDTGSSLTESIAYTRLDTLQSALGAPDTVTQLGVVAVDDTARHALRDRLRGALGAGAADLELLTWDEAMPEMVSFIEIDRRTGELFGLLIFLVVAFGIANTFLMAVMERVRELGLLSALGLTPARIGRLVVAEAVLLGVVSIVVGVALGTAAHLYFKSHGLDYAAMFGTELEISGVVLEDTVIRSVLEPARWALTCLAVLVLVTLSALYPAWRATRMSPADAMRTYE